MSKLYIFVVVLVIAWGGYSLQKRKNIEDRWQAREALSMIEGQKGWDKDPNYQGTLVKPTEIIWNQKIGDYFSATITRKNPSNQYCKEITIEWKEDSNKKVIDTRLVLEKNC